MSRLLPVKKAVLDLKRRRPLGGANDWRSAFKGTGRIAYRVVGVNNTAFGSTGDCATAAKFVERAGLPWHQPLRELKRTNVWACVEVPTLSGAGSASVPTEAARAIYQPMIPVRYDDACNVGDVTYPTTTLNGVRNFHLDTKSTAITRIGVQIGFTGDNCGVQRVQIMDASDNDVTASLSQYISAPTVAQAVARAQIPSSQLIANGGSLDPTWPVVGTTANDVARCGANRARVEMVLGAVIINGQLVDAPAGAYRLRLTNTLAKGNQQNTSTTVDRAYTYAALYGTAAMSHTDAGADLYLTRDLSPRNDASANETCTLAGFRTGSGNSDSGPTGGGHGYNDGTGTAVTVDSAAVVLYAKTLSRARNNNVATLVLDRTITGQVGSKISTTGTGGTGYGQAGATIATLTMTNVLNDTITFANTGTNEGTTADTGGAVFCHDVIVGSDNVAIAITSNFRHPQQGATVVATGQHTYVYSSAGYWKVRQPRITLSVDYTLTTGAYDFLKTLWGADPITYGPEYFGKAKIRQSSSASGSYLDNNNDSEVLVGEQNWYSAYSDYGFGVVVELNILSGAQKVTIQDSNLASGPPNHDKIYGRKFTASTPQSAGYTYGDETTLWFDFVPRDLRVFAA